MSSNQAALSSVLQKYQISPASAKRLETLQNYKIALILDDSSSMNTIDSADRQTSRWDDLSNFAKIVIEIAAVYNPEGCDVYFLNMQSVKKVRSIDQLSIFFQDRPAGATPLSRTIQNVITENPAQLLSNRNLLIIIATDGEPTDDSGYSNIPEFKHTLLNRPNNVYTNIAACTNDERSIGYLNGLDRELPRLDVVDDYASELAEVKRAKGAQFPFTYGDYVTKSILGSISPDLDRNDEPVQLQPAQRLVTIPEPVQPQKVIVQPQKEFVTPKPKVINPKKQKTSFLSRLHILSPDYSSKEKNTIYNKPNVPHLNLRDIFCCQ